MANDGTFGNAIKVVGETAFLPGASQLLDGKMASGIGHAVGGLLARAMLGPVGLWYAAGNSFSLSVSGKNLHEHFFGDSIGAITSSKKA